MNFKFNDYDIVQGIVNKDGKMTAYFFLEVCDHLTSHIQHEIFKGHMEKYEIVSELYLYLAHNNWKRLRQFDFRSQLLTWTSVVAWHFFLRQQKMLTKLPEPLQLDDNRILAGHPDHSAEIRMDIERTLCRMSNKRYRKIIEELVLADREPKEVAEEMGIHINTLYNLQHRALLQYQATNERMSHVVRMHAVPPEANEGIEPKGSSAMQDYTESNDWEEMECLNSELQLIPIDDTVIAI